MTTITEHVTGLGEIQFMCASRALKNKKTGKDEFSIKVKLKTEDPAVAHLLDVADYKVSTKTNRALEGTGETVISFTSGFAPAVLGVDGEVLEGSSIPFFDGRVDTGSAAVAYKVIDYGDNKIVRLSGIKLVTLEITSGGTDGEAGASMAETLETLKNICK